MMLSREPDESQSLATLQRWMQSVITHPSGIESVIASASAREPARVTTDCLERVVCRSERLSSADRLRIYGNAYFARLLECLRSEFPAMVKALGEEAFDGLAFGYLLEHPSQSYTLSRLAAELPNHLEATRPPREANVALSLREREAEVNSTSDERAAFLSRSERATLPDFADFLIDLAHLERTYSEVFDGPGPEQFPALKPSDLEGLSADEFAASQLVLHDCVRLLSLRFPVHEFATAVRHGQEADFPEVRPTHLVVTRRDYIVRRFEVSPMQFALLAALRDGVTVGEALLAMQPDDEADLSQLATDLRCWFFDWSAAPLFCRLERSRGT